MRRAAKVDVTQADIVKALQNAGATVMDLSGSGKKGCPDLAVGFRGVNYFIECKPNIGSPSRRKLRDSQREWHEGWKGHASVAETPEAALAIIGYTVTKVRGVIR